MRHAWLATLLLAGLGACGYVSFGRKVGTAEWILQQEIRSYYDNVQLAFAAGNPQALAGLFDPGIAKPMTQTEILAWGEKFFGEHKKARFRIEKLVFDELGYLQAVVTLTYRVETPEGRGDFGGTERDALVKRRGRWYISAWEKLP